MAGLECPIYFTTIKTAKTLPCGHVFEAAAIDGWLAKCPTCPMCRATVVGTTTLSAFSEDCESTTFIVRALSSQRFTFDDDGDTVDEPQDAGQPHPAMPTSPTSTATSATSAPESSIRRFRSRSQRISASLASRLRAVIRTWECASVD